MDDATIELILSGAGIVPGSPQYTAMKSALQASSQGYADTQGLKFAQDKLVAQQTNDNAKKKLDNDYQIAKMSASNDAERNRIDDWYKQQSVALDQQRVQIEQGNLAVSQGNLAVAQGNLGVNQGNLEVNKGAQGLSLIKTGVDLGSQVNDWAKQADWYAGVGADDQAPAFLRALLNNTGAYAGSNAPTMTAPQGLPEQSSLTSTLAKVGGGTGSAADQTNAALLAAAAPGSGTVSGPGASTGVTASANDDPRTIAIKAIANKFQPSETDGWGAKDVASLRAIAALAAQGTAKGANRFAQLDPSDQQFTAAGLQKLGIDGARWLRTSDNQRVSNASSGLAA